jgi:nitric oxide reductase subunit B
MKRYWWAFASVIFASFAVLLWVGSRIYHQAPPIAERVVTSDGIEVIAADEIETGQNVWQAMGGMQVGSIWGHGSYVAPDWTADWLHREATFALEEWSQAESGRPFGDLDVERQAALTARLTASIRRNTYDANTGRLTIEPWRARAFAANEAHYADVFAQGRAAYAIPAGTQVDPVKLHALSAFFFWSSWAASTNRPNDDVSYTSNWPHEKLVGNQPTSDSIVWTGVSILALLAGIGGLSSWHASKKPALDESAPPATDPLLGGAPTPSQKATLKYFWVVTALILLQALLGVITAHYGVEGAGFYGIPLADILPYSVTRTWHTQLGIFWIATAWLAAGLYIGPAIGAKEPKLQRLGVNVLFGALLVVVLGSMTGEWLSVKGYLSGDAWFYFGHSGYEYIDLGRFFQIALLIGLFLWFFLVARAVLPALRRKDEQRPILVLFLISSLAIASFYGAALGYGRHTNLAVAEYWRWWVVHLWVEGFFEVFATVVIAFLFARMRLIDVKSAGRATVLSASIFLSGGIIGTLHHLYFSGTPTFVLALGSVFSALEVVPLMLIGYEAWENIRHARAQTWVSRYRWPIYFFVAVAFWNLLGAGVFGFMINPPIALYYMQGLNTTPVHGHAALFGVYGMLGIGLMLFCLQLLTPQRQLDERLMKWSFILLNVGLFAMVVISLLPVGLMQTWASVKVGYWYARSPEFLQTPVMQRLRWLRVPGDTLFAAGIATLAAAVIQMSRRPASRAETTAARLPSVHPGEARL